MRSISYLFVVIFFLFSRHITAQEGNSHYKKIVLKDVPKHVLEVLEKKGSSKEEPENPAALSKPHTLMDIEKIPAEGVRALAWVDTDRLAIGTFGGLLVMDLKTGKIQKAGAKDAHVNCIALGPEGEL